MPVGVAYANLLGLPPESGIFTAVFALICYSLLGTSHELVIGPDSASAALLVSSAFALGITGQDLNIQFIMFTTVVAGLLFFLAGFLRLGFISDFISKPILIGFLNGVAIILVIGQLQKFTGVEVKESNSIFGLFEFIGNIRSVHLPTLIIGIISFIGISSFKKKSGKIPAPLALIILSIIATVVFKLSDFGIIFTPEIKSSFPLPVMPDFEFFKTNYKTIVVDAAAVMLLTYTNTILVGKTFTKDKKVFNADKEFFAMGLSDLVSGLFRGFPSSSSTSQTLINIDSGSRSKLSKIIAAFILIIVVFFFAKEFSLIPVAVFAAIIISSSYDIFNFRDFMEVRKYNKYEFYVSLVCLIGVLVIGVLDGIFLALVISIIYLIKGASRPEEYELAFDPQKNLLHKSVPENEHLLSDNVLIYRFNSAMLFFNSGYFRTKLFEKITRKAKPELIIVDASPVNYIDITFRDDLAEIIKELNGNGQKLLFLYADNTFENKLSEMLVKKELDPEIFYNEVNAALSNVRPG